MRLSSGRGGGLGGMKALLGLGSNGIGVSGGGGGVGRVGSRVVLGTLLLSLVMTCLYVPLLQGMGLRGESTL